MALTTQQQLLVEQRLGNERKSSGVANLLRSFPGGPGAHRLQLGHSGSGCAMLAPFILGLVLSGVAVGFALLFAVGIRALAGALLISGMIRKDMQNRRNQNGREVAVLAAA